MLTSLLPLLVLASILRDVASFMPNYVFSFRPPNGPTSPSDGGGLPGVEIAAGFLPGDFYPIEEEEGPLHDNSWTHKDIIRRACLNAVARFYEDTIPRLASGSITGLHLLTPATLLRAVFGPETSSSNFERAIEDIEIAAARMDLFYEVNATLDEAANIARAHFDDEQFDLGQKYLLQLRRQMFAAVQKEALPAARDLAGRFMLTLQDFYSQSNYVELGRTEVLEELGEKAGATFLSTVAGPNDVVCADCREPYTNNSCVNNVITQKLTSGYFFYPTDIVDFSGLGGPFSGRVKPTGKCSYGDKVDQSRTLSATGGINKSTRNYRKSPHHYLHEPAAQLAIKATEHFLNGIRDVIGDDKFLQFFNLGRSIGGSSLCFVIDQSGSMRDDIEAARARAKEIVNSTADPFNYVLVQFNDYDKSPAFGPPIVTQDADEFITELDKLTPDGGGDCPELAMHGLQLALTSSLPGSSLYVFTDAGAKDCELTQTVLSQIDRLNSIVNFFYTGPGVPCGSCPNDFDTIATRSGGQLLSLDKQTVSQATRLTEASAEASLVVLLASSNSNSSGSYSFRVDCTVKKIFISLSGQTPTVSIRQPDGSNFTSTDQLLLNNFLLINITNPMIGDWTFDASFAAREHSVIVRASSTINFDFNFVFVGGRPGHLGVFPISGQPIADTLTKVVLTVDGLEDTNAGDGFKIDLIDGMSRSIAFFDPEQGIGYSTNLFGIAFVSPTIPFRLRLSGTDKCGGTFIRVAPTETRAQTLGFSTPDANLPNVIAPGGFTNATFRLHNSGDTDVIDVAYNDELGFGEDIIVLIEDEPISSRRRRRRGLSSLTESFTLKGNETAHVTVSYSAPKSARFGQANTATITASARSGETFNYVSFQVVVAPDEQDETAPTCRVLEYTTCAGVSALECNRYERRVRAQFHDEGIGLQTIRTRQRGVRLEYDFESGTNETVNVTATSSCCYLAIDFESSDVVGNLQSSRCSAVIAPGVPNDRIALVGILTPDGSKAATGIVRLVVENWKTLYYSVNVTGVIPTTFRLSNTKNGRVGDPLFTLPGFNYGNILSGSLPVDGSYLPIIYGRMAYGTVQYIEGGEEKSIGGQILYDNLPAEPDYEAMLSCQSDTCSVGGYVALTLNTGTLSSSRASYYLLVGSQNVSTAYVDDLQRNRVTQLEGGVSGLLPGTGEFGLSMSQLRQLEMGELFVTVSTTDGSVLTGQLRRPWMPTLAPTTPSGSLRTVINAGAVALVTVFLALFLY